LEEFIAEFQDIFETKFQDYRRTDRVSHSIDTINARPIRRHFADSNWPSRLR
jgi:hypothetical protein